MDQDLISKAIAGNASAIGTLYEMYQGVVFRFMYYQTGDHKTAEDLTAEVFLRVIKALPRYKENGVSIKPWLFQIARNLAIDHFRKSNNRDHVELRDDLPSVQHQPESTTERRLLHNDLFAALIKLTSDQREVIVLRFIIEMPIREVAQTLNKNESAIKALQRRGLKALSKTLRSWRKPND